jgi:hypothetical protein
MLKLEAKLREEEAERERLKRRQEEELRALLQRLENTSNALAVPCPLRLASCSQICYCACCRCVLNT